VCLCHPVRGERGTVAVVRVGRSSYRFRAHEIKRGQWRHVHAALGGEAVKRLHAAMPQVRHSFTPQPHGLRQHLAATRSRKEPALTRVSRTRSAVLRAFSLITRGRGTAGEECDPISRRGCYSGYEVISTSSLKPRSRSWGFILSGVAKTAVKNRDYF